jgi:hypothetical protein
MEGVSFEPRKQTEVEKHRAEVGKFFDMHKSSQERYDVLLSKMEILINEGLLDKEKITPELKECSEIQNKNEFINKTLVVLYPVLEIWKKNPRLDEKLRAENFLEQGNFIKLNDVLSYGISKNSAHIHLAPSKELLRETGKQGYINLISDGLKKLAEIVKENVAIEKITATSMVVTENPKRMTEFGFAIKGPISDEQREKHWKGNKSDISVAEMSRERLLEYLNK